jgi:alpha-beta hydrolase superfamily lysophospholipase
MQNPMIFLFILVQLLLTPFVNAETLLFNNGKEQLFGHYLAPKNLAKDEAPKAVLLFVHGDGEISYDAEGYYSSIWQALRAQGYAIFSWDKPGVGKSEGNWLKQSMLDRQLEVIAAINAVQKKHYFTSKNTGLIGFSQAGWVLPALANDKSKISFMIGIGFARNWIKQGEYHTKTRLTLSSANKQQINEALVTNKKETLFFDSTPTYEQYLKRTVTDPMTKQRYQFVLKNYQSDATADYSNINVPTLLLWGDGDLNVDPQQEFKWWQAIANKNPFVSTHIIQNASHGMLNAKLFDTQVFGIKQWLKLMWLEEDAFAENFIPTLILWLNQHTNSIQNT